MMRLFFTFFLFIFTISPVLASEEVIETSAPIERFREADWSPHILLKFDPAARQDEPTKLKPPFALNSEEQQKETDYMSVITKARTQGQVKQFEILENDPLSHLFALLNLDHEKYIETRLLFASALHTLDKKIWEEKWRYQRLRPTQIDPLIDSLKPLPGSASYPAEKASQTRMIAYILSEIFPEHDYVWIGWSNHVAKLYELAGLNFPSDTKAGTDLAETYYNIMNQQIDYKNMVLNSQIELIDFEINIDSLIEEIGPVKKPTSFP